MSISSSLAHKYDEFDEFAQQSALTAHTRNWKRGVRNIFARMNGTPKQIMERGYPILTYTLRIEKWPFGFLKTAHILILIITQIERQIPLKENRGKTPLFFLFTPCSQFVHISPARLPPAGCRFTHYYQLPLYAIRFLVVSFSHPVPIIDTPIRRTPVCAGREESRKAVKALA